MHTKYSYKRIIIRTNNALKYDFYVRISGQNTTTKMLVLFSYFFMFKLIINYVCGFITKKVFLKKRLCKTRSPFVMVFVKYTYVNVSQCNKPPCYKTIQKTFITGVNNNKQTLNTSPMGTLDK